MDNHLIILLGAPGSGKGTQSELLISTGDYNTISMGDIVRSEIKNRTKFALTMQSYLDKGDLVPDQLICDLFYSHFKKVNNNKNLILDGFPRTLAQCEYLNDFVHNYFTSLKVIYIDVPEENLMNRLLLRKRSDDTREVILNRLKTFNREVTPILDFYKANLVKLNGNQDVNSLNLQISEKLN